MFSKFTRLRGFLREFIKVCERAFFNACYFFRQRTNITRESPISITAKSRRHVIQSFVVLNCNAKDNFYKVVTYETLISFPKTTSRTSFLALQLKPPLIHSVPFNLGLPRISKTCGADNTWNDHLAVGLVGGRRLDESSYISEQTKSKTSLGMN